MIDLKYLNSKEKKKLILYENILENHRLYGNDRRTNALNIVHNRLRLIDRMHDRLFNISESFSIIKKEIQIDVLKNISDIRFSRLLMSFNEEINDVNNEFDRQILRINMDRDQFLSAIKFRIYEQKRIEIESETRHNRQGFGPCVVLVVRVG